MKFIVIYKYREEIESYAQLGTHYRNNGALSRVVLPNGVELHFFSQELGHLPPYKARILLTPGVDDPEIIKLCKFRNAVI